MRQKVKVFLQHVGLQCTYTVSQWEEEAHTKRYTGCVLLLPPTANITQISTYVNMANSDKRSDPTTKGARMSPSYEGIDRVTT